MRFVRWLPLTSIMLAKFLVAQPAPPQLNLMPLPSNYTLGNGQLAIDQDFSVAITGYAEARLGAAVQRFLRNLSKRTGLAFHTQLADPARATLVIQTDHAGKEIQEPGEDESYVLETTPSSAKLSAPTPLGAMHGLQTFMQLAEAGPSGFAVPAIRIDDTPRFPWRGLMIDVSRHFIPLDVIKRNLDGMEAVKLNVFHWHLSDNQGFRVESRKFPKLHEAGSNGLYYTQEEIRDLLGYARDRGIRVVPEFDMPGHSTSWFVGYPELASAPGPYHLERYWGVFDPAMDPTEEHTYKFLDEFIGEMAALFPDPYFHIGGDEVNGKQWTANARIQQFRREQDIRNNQALQEYFTGRVRRLVSEHGKIMVGWDEILTPDIPKSIVIHSWRGPESLAAAAKMGYRGILSNGYYIDLMWPAERHYLVDPLSGAAGNLSPEEQERILGGEATMWTEYVSGENIDSRIWPRTAAIAERLWSPQYVRDVNSMYGRLSQISWRLDSLGLTHNAGYIPRLQRIANRQDVAALRTLADVVEPVKEYTREDLASSRPGTMTPLNRVVDAVAPESEAGRAFSSLVDSFISTECRETASAAQIRAVLSTWRDNQAALQVLVETSFLVKEVAGLSQNLARLGAAGLQALDSITGGEPTSGAWKTEKLAIIDQAKKPGSAQLLLMIAAPVQKLVEASQVGGTCQSAK